MNDPSLPTRRQRLGAALDAVGLVDAFARARRVLGVPALPVLTYHRIAAADAPDDFNPGVIDATPAAFERHVAMLTRHFTLVGTRELRDHFRGKRPLPHAAAMITFDDGYRSCRDVALPVLRRYDARAVFFVSTGHITHRRTFWWDRLSYTVKRSRASEIAIAYPRRQRIERTPGDEESVTRALLRVIKDTHALDVERFLSELSDAAGVPWSAALDAQLGDRLLLDWDDVRELRAAGMDVESHTRSHRVLDTLPHHELDDELGGSREDLEAQLREPVRAIAYPVGWCGGEHVTRAVSRAGYELGFSNGTGLNADLGSTQPLFLRRIAIDGSFTDGSLRAAMVVPDLTPKNAPRRAIP